MAYNAFERLAKNLRNIINAVGYMGGISGMSRSELGRLTPRMQFQTGSMTGRECFSASIG